VEDLSFGLSLISFNLYLYSAFIQDLPIGCFVLLSQFSYTAFILITLVLADLEFTLYVRHLLFLLQQQQLVSLSSISCGAIGH